MFKFNEDVIIMRAVNESKSKCIIAINYSKFTFAFLKTYSLLYIITEEPGQHVRSEAAFASQNLKFARQMSDDRH